MLLSAVPVLVVAQSSSEIPEGLMNNPVVVDEYGALLERWGQKEEEIVGEKPGCPPHNPMD